MYTQVEKAKKNKCSNAGNSVFLEKRNVAQGTRLVDNRTVETVGLKTNNALLSRIPKSVPSIQFCREDVGLVPPTTHGRDKKYKTPSNPRESRGKLHAIAAKDLTRSERMINRIGRIMVQEANVHVAVALDGNAIVISANAEDENIEQRIDKIAAKLKDILTLKDPLGENASTIGHHNVTGKRRIKDIKKVQRLLRGDYTDDEGIELNDEVKVELAKIKTAIEKGVIDQRKYENGDSGIYVIITPSDKSNRLKNMHGELKVTEAIKKRRKEHPDAGYKDVFVGGTWLDCFSCNASHKIMNETLVEDGQSWKFYTGGTHGGMYVGYRPNSLVVTKHLRFQELTGSEVYLDSRIPKVKDNVIPENGQLPYDSDSEDEDYDELEYDRKLFREKKVGRDTLKTAAKSTEDSITCQTDLLEKQNKRVELITIKLERAKEKLSYQISQATASKGQLESLTKEKDKCLAELSKLSGDVSGEIATMKNKVESELQGKKVKWDGKWVPDPEKSWTPRGRTEYILEKYTNSAHTHLSLISAQNQKEKKRVESRLEEIPKLIVQWEKSLNETNKLIEELTKKIEELENSKLIAEKEKEVIEATTQEEIRRLKEVFFTTHKIPFEKATRSEESRRRLRGKMDNFQFGE